MSANAGAIRAGRAFVELFADDSKLVRGLKVAEDHLKGFGKRVQEIGLGFAAFGAGLLTPLIASAKIFAEMGDGLDEMSQRTGITVESLSQLRSGVELAGSDMAGFETAIRKMQRTLTDAANGSQSAQESLAALGVDVKAIAALSPEQQFLALADAISKIEDPTARAAAAVELFGRSGTAILPLIEEGAQGVVDGMADAARRGQTVTAEQAHQAAELADGWQHLTDSLKTVAVTIGSQLAPALVDVSQTIVAVVRTVRDWLDANSTIVPLIARLGVTCVALGSAIAAVGIASKTAAVGIGIMRSAIAAMNVAIAILTAHPIVAVLTAIAAAIAAIAISQTDWSKVFDTNGLATTVGELKRHFGEIENSFKRLKGEQAKAAIQSQLENLQDQLDPIKQEADALRAEKKAIRDRTGAPGQDVRDFQKDALREMAIDKRLKELAPVEKELTAQTAKLEERLQKLREEEAKAAEAARNKIVRAPEPEFDSTAEAFKAAEEAAKAQEDAAKREMEDRKSAPNEFSPRLKPGEENNLNRVFEAELDAAAQLKEAADAATEFAQGRGPETLAAGTQEAALALLQHDAESAADRRHKQNLEVIKAQEKTLKNIDKHLEKSTVLDTANIA